MEKHGRLSRILSEVPKKPRYWTLTLQARFLKRFSQLLLNGFSLMEALEVTAVLFHPAKIQELADSCRQGLPFADALEKARFDRRAVYMVRVSERAGALVQGLTKAQAYTGRLLANREELRKKLRYPLFLFGAMIAAMAGIYFFFIPQLEQFAESFGLEGGLEGIHAILILLGSIFAGFGLLGGCLLYVFKGRSPKLIDIFNIPFLQKPARRLFSYYFASQWAMFIECGLSLKDSLQTIKDFERVPLLRQMVAGLEKQLMAGQSLGEVVGQGTCFTPYFRLVILHALSIGCVPAELKQFAKEELEAFNAQLNGAFKWIQAVFMLLIGVMIVILYLSLLAPVFNLVNLL